MSRVTARECVFKLVYEYIVNGEKNELSLELLTDDEDINKDDFDFVNTIYDGVTERFEELKSMVAGFSNRFAIDRVFNIDLAILIVALYELKYTDIPKAVAINEAAELAKRYSTEKSHAFINGILASAA